jgi:hypothetical protein
MNDDIIDRLGKTLLLMGGGFGFLYLMITSTQDHPRGIALVIVRTTETVAHWIMYAGITVAVFFIAWAIFEQIKTKRQHELERIENEKRVLLSRQLAEAEELKQREEKLQAEIRQKQIEDERKLTQQRLQIEKEIYLKTRSAEDAAKDALKHFM